MRIVIKTSDGEVSYLMSPEELEQARDEYERQKVKEEIKKAAKKNRAWLPNDFPFDETADEIRHTTSKNRIFVNTFWDTAIKITEEAVEKFTMQLWDEFGDVPMNPKTECIEIQWRDFPAGTHREEIWHWFEDTLGASVYTLMFS